MSDVIVLWDDEPKKKKDPFPGSYRPPIESVCCHGKTIGPCPHCAAVANSEWLQNRTGQ